MSRIPEISEQVPLKFSEDCMVPLKLPEEIAWEIIIMLIIFNHYANIVSYISILYYCAACKSLYAFQHSVWC